MKRIHVLALFLVAPLAAPQSSLNAQEIVPFVGGGLAVGTSDLATNTNNGWLVFGGIDVPIAAAPGVSVGVTASHARIPFSEGLGDEMQVTAISGEVSYLFGSVTSMVRPYLRGGGGLNVHRYEPGSSNFSSTTDSRLGVSAGAGANVMAGSVDVLLGARFTSGSDAGFLGIHGGLAIPIR